MRGEARRVRSRCCREHNRNAVIVTTPWESAGRQAADLTAMEQQRHARATSWHAWQATAGRSVTSITITTTTMTTMNATIPSAPATIITTMTMMTMTSTSITTITTMTMMNATIPSEHAIITTTIMTTMMTTSATIPTAACHRPPRRTRTTARCITITITATTPTRSSSELGRGDARRSSPSEADPQGALAAAGQTARPYGMVLRAKGSSHPTVRTAPGCTSTTCPARATSATGACRW